MKTQPGLSGSWDKAGRWAFVALPPGQLPAAADEHTYVSAAASLERVLPQAAGEAYRAAIAKWPDNLVARIGLGNVAYGLHQMPEAQAQYRRAAQDHVDSADAWNNLAQVLHEMGHDADAAVAARRAIAIGGQREQTYRSTLQAIESGPSR